MKNRDKRVSAVLLNQMPYLCELSFLDSSPGDDVSHQRLQNRRIVFVQSLSLV